MGTVNKKFSFFVLFRFSHVRRAESANRLAGGTQTLSAQRAVFVRKQYSYESSIRMRAAEPRIRAD